MQEVRNNRALCGTPEPERSSLSDLLRAATRSLSGSSDSPTLDAELLLAAAIGGTRTTLYAHPERVPSAAQHDRFERLLRCRRAGQPVAYLLGEREFWSLKLKVGPGVLVPRPETELLVERALLRSPGESACVLDLGTGSGAIALALGRERPGWNLVATDLSEAALGIAGENAVLLKATNVRFQQGDWFQALDGQRFDLIVSNPPYVEAADPHLKALRYEPLEALESGADGLRDIRRIVGDAPGNLTAGGWLLLEHGAGQGKAVRALFEASGFTEIDTVRDAEDRERVTEGRWASRGIARPHFLEDPLGDLSGDGSVGDTGE